MKRTTVIIMLMVFSVAFLLQFYLNTQTVLAQDNNYTIQRVDHQVEVMYSGHVVISDTISITGQLTGDFLIGFPHKYGSHVLKGIAYNDNNVFPVSLGVQFGDQSGYYGAKISFPQSAPKVFTIAFFLSNDLLSPKTNGFILDFPAYPTFVKDAGQCNVTLILPGVASLLNVTKTDGVVYTENFLAENLKGFTYSPALAYFNVPDIWIRLININTLNREILVNPVSNVEVSDSYHITNNSPSIIDSVRLLVPSGVTNIIARDDVGKILTTEIRNDEDDTLFVNVNFTSSLASGQFIGLKLAYIVSKVSFEQDSSFILNIDIFPDFNYYIDIATVTIILPEGARFLAPQRESIDSSVSLNRGTFQETLTLRREGVNKKEYTALSNVFQIRYTYNPLWLSFRPTLWMWTILAVGTVIIAVWRRPKAAAPLRVAAAKASIGLSPDHVRAFNEAYEEKNRLTSEAKFLEARAQKGKIPRRRYKVQRRTLEVRLDTLSKNLAELKTVFRNAGGVYADLVRQLDIAETELVEIATNIRTIEVRHSRGELPLEAYKKSLADYQRRKEKAEATINGILLRLREEIH